MRTTLAVITSMVLGLALGACDPDDEEAPLEGVIVYPRDLILDFGTIYECTEHSDTVTIVNYGPDDQHVVIDADSLIYHGYVISSMQPEIDLEAGDEYEMTIRVSPGEGGAGTREAPLFIYADRSITIMVKTEIVAGNEC